MDILKCGVTVIFQNSHRDYLCLNWGKETVPYFYKLSWEHLIVYYMAWKNPLDCEQSANVITLLNKQVNMEVKNSD